MIEIEGSVFLVSRLSGESTKPLMYDAAKWKEHKMKYGSAYKEATIDQIKSFYPDLWEIYEQEQTAPPLKSLKVSELRELAAAEGVELSGDEKKDDLIKILSADR